MAGGTPVEFGVIACCDGVANGHEGMRYILPSRDIIAHSVEVMVQAHRLDAVVLLGSCDKIVPGMLMAAARLDLPAILLNGGPSEGGCMFDGRSADITSAGRGLGMLKRGRISQEEYARWRKGDAHLRVLLVFGHRQHHGLCGRGLGMALPGSATIPATHADRMRVAQASGRTHRGDGA
jgi:dihydroxy-acid dehydratase